MIYKSRIGRQSSHESYSSQQEILRFQLTSVIQKFDDSLHFYCVHIVVAGDVPVSLHAAEI